MSAHQPTPEKSKLETGLAESLQDEISTLRAKLSVLRGEARDLRSHKEELGTEILHLMAKKNDIEQQVLAHEAGLAKRADQRRGNKSGFGRALSLGARGRVGATGPKAALSMWGEPDEPDGTHANERWEQEERIRSLEALNGELEDKYSEALRHLKIAQGTPPCQNCSPASATGSPLIPSSDAFERDNTPDSGEANMTQSCYLPEPTPHPDRNRRQIALDEPPSGEEEGNRGDSKLSVSSLRVVDLHPRLSSVNVDPFGLEDYHIVDPSGAFCITASLLWPKDSERSLGNTQVSGIPWRGR